MEFGRSGHKRWEITSKAGLLRDLGFVSMTGLGNLKVIQGKQTLFQFQGTLREVGLRVPLMVAYLDYEVSHLAGIGSEDQ